MHLFARPIFESECTQFLNGLRKSDPTLQEKQAAGWALLRDKPLDLEQRQRDEDSRVKRSGYVYK